MTRRFFEAASGPGPGVVEAFELQAMFCRQLGSPFYGDLLERAAEDVRQRGAVGRLVEGWQGNAVADALVLRLLGAVHDLVLAGRVPPLASFYPSTGGAPRWPATWDAFLDVAEEHADFLRTRLNEGVQTNEVSRCAALLGGFLEVASRTALPLRTREIGASAGLNLMWDAYRYELGSHAWGDPTAAVAVRAEWTGPPPALDAPVSVLDRLGCDLAPVDVGDDAQVRRLRSFIWPEQLDRMAVFAAAIEHARRRRPPVERARARDWLRAQLTSDRDGVATVVYQSVVWWYIPEAERDEITRMLNDAGSRSTEKGPLAWLRMEPMKGPGFDVTLTLWPKGEERLLARAHPHGREVEWLGG